jgi:hypothetical protein
VLLPTPFPVNNQHRAIVLTLLITPFVAFGISRGLLLEKMDFYNFWQWTIDYDIEFVRRGLLGSVLGFFGIDAALSPNVIYVAALVVLTLFACQLVFLACCFLLSNDSFEAFLVVLVFTMLPMTLAWYSFDLGRVDQVNYVLFLSSILCLRYSTGFWLLSGLMVCIAGLIHEGFFVIQYPMFLTISVLLCGKNWRKMALVTIPPALVFLTIMAFGNIQSIGYEQYVSYLDNKFDIDIGLESAGVIYYLSLAENIGLTVSTWYFEGSVNTDRLVALLVAVLACLPGFATLFIWTKKERDPALFLLVTVAVIPCILLNLIGIDLFRWMSMAITNGFLSVFLYSCLKPEFQFTVVRKDGETGRPPASIYSIHVLLLSLVLASSGNYFYSPGGDLTYRHWPFPKVLIKGENTMSERDIMSDGIKMALSPD